MSLPQTLAGIGAPGIDPTGDEMVKIATVGDIFKWIGSSGPFVEAVLKALGGGEPKIRDLVSISAKDWHDTMDAVRPEGERGMSAIERGQYALVRRIARLRLQLTANDESSVSGGTPTTTLAISAAAVAPPLPVAEPRIKLSVLIDSTMDSELVRLPVHQIRVMYSEYVKTRGAEPSEDIEPTTEQISAVKQVLDADLVPYVDFALFGPYGKRFLQKLTLVNWSYLPNGTWLRRELPGPPTLEYWWSSFRVLRTTFLLLGTVDTELLDNYGELVRGFHNTYGSQAWFIIYMADVRMRNEHFDRLRRHVERDHEKEARAGITSDFDLLRPWNTVFAKAVADKDWWNDNLHRPAMLYLGRIQSAAAVTDDGTAQPALDQHRGGGHVGDSGGSGHIRARSRSRGKGQPKRKKNQNSTSQGICNQCNSAKGCRRDDCKRDHSCSFCKKPGHSKIDCFSDPSSSSSKTWGPAKGGAGGGKQSKGKGKGKGKKF